MSAVAATAAVKLTVNVPYCNEKKVNRHVAWNTPLVPSKVTVTVSLAATAWLDP